MDTKSRKFSSNIVLRTVIFLLCAAAVTTFMLSFAIAAAEHNELQQLIIYSDEELYQSHLNGYDAIENRWDVYDAAVAQMWYNWLPALAISGIVGIFSFLWLVMTTGPKLADDAKRPEWNANGTRKLYFFDRIWTELQVIALCIAGSFAVFLWSEPWFQAFRNCDEIPYLRFDIFTGHENKKSLFAIVERYMQDISSEEAALLVIGITVCVALALWFFLSIVRLLKSRMFWRNSLVGKICIACGGTVWRTFERAMNSGSLARKIMIICIGIAVLSASIFLAPVMIVVAIVFAPKWAARFDEVQKGVDEVRSGNLAYKIPINENGKDDELKRLARGINEISAASNTAVQNELKNQRMKTELISNVSHDLKTPLTSIVTYIDLLKTEGLDSPNAPEYLAILDAKADRLKKLTEDLFEAAKASSGAMPVNMTSLDMISLINQVMGEMNDRIQASGLEFILGYNTPRVVGDVVTENTSKTGVPVKFMVDADGQLLYRVMDNLLNNVLKYAQPQSRVYIDVSDIEIPSSGRSMAGNQEATAAVSIAGMPGVSGSSEGFAESRDLVLVEVKNISKQALNINPDELMERFKRGDESRTTEGSGLGLAIAKDLVKLMGGWLELTIDGDLFKVQVYLNKSAEYAQPDPEAAI